MYRIVSSREKRLGTSMPFVDFEFAIPAFALRNTYAPYTTHPFGFALSVLYHIIFSQPSRDSWVGTATEYELDCPGSIPGRGKRFSLLHSVQNGSGIHPASCPVRIGGAFQGLKRPGVKLSTQLQLVPRS
jgi:hypothetical protein